MLKSGTRRRGIAESKRGSSRIRRGVVLVVAVVTIAVMAVLATVIFAALQSGGGIDRIVLASDILFRFKTEIIGPPPSFYERLKVYPGGLSHLVEPITTLKKNSCGDLYKASPDVNNWRGPYHLIPFNPVDGYVLSLGIVAQDSTIRTTFTNGALALAIVMNDVQVADAQSLKARIDGTSGDTIKFTPDINNPDNPVVVYYLMPITSLC